MHARFSDHARLTKCSRWRPWTYCLPLHRQRRHPESVFYRGSMAGLHVPLPTLRRHPRGCLRTAWGRWGSLLLHRSRLAPPTPCRSPGRTHDKTAKGAARNAQFAAVSRMACSHNHWVNQCASRSASKVEIPESKDPVIAVAASTPRGKPTLQAAAMKIAVTGRAMTK